RDSASPAPQSIAPLRDSRGVEVPALPPRADSIARPDSSAPSDSLGQNAVTGAPLPLRLPLPLPVAAVAGGVPQVSIPALLDTGGRAPSLSSPAPVREAARRGASPSVDTARGEIAGGRADVARRS